VLIIAESSESTVIVLVPENLEPNIENILVKVNL